MAAKDWVDAVLRAVEVILSWPLVVLAVVIVLRRGIAEFLTQQGRRISKASVGPVSVEFVPALAALQDTVVQARETLANAPEELANFLVRQIDKLTQVSQRGHDGSAAGAGRQILWVDDNPTNNLYEMNYLRRLGDVVTPVVSTAQALEQLRAGYYDLVISDVFRVEEVEEIAGEPLRPRGGGAEKVPDAGYVLLRKMRSRGLSTPLILYTSDGARARERLIIEHLDTAATAVDQPGDLFEAVRAAVAAPPTVPVAPPARLSAH
jgi:CheY-like chemotaxis protein